MTAVYKNYKLLNVGHGDAFKMFCFTLAINAIKLFNIYAHWKSPNESEAVYGKQTGSAYV